MSVVCELALGLDAGWAGVTERVGRGVERVSTERICRRGLMEKSV